MNYKITINFSTTEKLPEEVLQSIRYLLTKQMCEGGRVIKKSIKIESEEN